MVKKLFIVLCFICAFGCVPQKKEVLPIPDVSAPLKFTPVEPEKWQLPNGITVMLIEDHELPLVRGALYIPGGAYYQSDQDFGDALLMGGMLRQGGAGEKGPDELDDALEYLAANVSSSFGDYYGEVSFRCLESQVDEVFGIFSDVLFRPKFNYERLQVVKAQTLDGIRRRKDNPSTIASHVLNAHIYGDTPLARELDSGIIRGITPWHLKKAYLKYVRPNGAILTFTGPISRKQINKLLAQEFVHWKPMEEKFANPSISLPEPSPAIYYVEAPLSQATVLMGHIGVPLMTPDHFALKLFNEVFSGGFGARLFSNVRSKEGLAYTVYGGVLPAFVRGKNLIYLQTQAQSVGKAILTSIDTLEELRRKSISNDELQEMRRGMENSYVFKFSSPDATVEREVFLDLWGFPQSYYENYLSNLRSVYPEQVKNAAQIRWNPGQFTIVVVGNEEALKSLRSIRSSLPGKLQSVPVQVGQFEEDFTLTRLIS